jgi:hypothetical protein
MAANPSSLFPTTTTTSTTTTTNHVSFDKEKDVIHEIPHHKEMSSKERKDLWLEPQEYLDIIAATRLTVTEMQRRNNSSPLLSAHKHKKGKKVRNEKEDEDLYCFRGVEELIQELALRREMLIVQSVDAVTNEQAKQRRQKQQQQQQQDPYSPEDHVDVGGRTVQEVNDHDGPERIAQAYMVFTQASSQRAQDMGMKDEAEALRLATLSSSSSDSAAENFQKRSSSSFSNGKNPARRLSGLVKQVVQIVRFR